LEAWSDDGRVAFEHVAGTKEREAVMTVRGDDGPSLVFTDVVFNMPHLPGLKGWLLRYVTASSGGPKVSRLGKVALVADKQALRAHLLRLADTPGLQRVFVAHHEPILVQPAEALRQVAATLA
jgi:hypothetical protein